MVGDWNGDGADSIGVFNANEARWNLRNSNSMGNPEISVLFGVPNSAFPVVGDWR